ncbi:Peptide deformylase 2 [bioreactor metagenome]|uniref:Peptide deformylase 2 n=1 Tax=bioreactor metagenome TaxID=1076179 RepID=A0A645CXE4_9ZZZZ|nr:peptide deformylase [Erysipelotrichaceae bacterium]
MSNKYVTILDDRNPALRKKADPVSLPLTKKDSQILKNMLKYISDSHDDKLKEKYQLLPASGLAAPQIGVNKCLITVFVEDEVNDVTVETKLALANPKIISHSEQLSYLKAGEGCLSVKEPHEGYVPRHARITVKAFDLFTEQEITIRAKGYLAVVLQHEIDHLSGILFYDRINKDNPYYEIPDAIVIE